MCKSSTLSDNSMAVEGGTCGEEKEEGANTVHDGNPPECSSITEILDDGAAKEDADTDAEIPAGEEG
jgi:hypothetical protein